MGILFWRESRWKGSSPEEGGNSSGIGERDRENLGMQRFPKFSESVPEQVTENPIAGFCIPVWFRVQNPLYKFVQKTFQSIPYRGVANSLLRSGLESKVPSHRVVRVPYILRYLKV